MGRKKTGGIQHRGERSFRIRYYVDGIRHEETIKGSLDDAQAELAIRLGDIAKGYPVSSKPNTVLFEDLASDVLTDYKINGLRSYSDVETRFRLHLLPVFGKRKASQITTSQIKNYIAARQEAKASTGTINRELEAMRRAFRLAFRSRKILVQPHMPMLRENNVRAGFFTRGEVDRLCSFLRPAPALFVKFGFLTGWRKDEIRRLAWTNVDFESGEIRLFEGTTKTRDGRVFPITAELRALLLAARDLKQAKKKSRHAAVISPLVFHAEGKPILEFRKSWARACQRAGLPVEIETEKVTIQRGKKKGEKRMRVKRIIALRIFHDLRRSAAKNLIAQGIPERVVMQICGWKTRIVFDRYSIVGKSDLDTARERMELANRAKNGANVVAMTTGKQ